jgi:hypothetical protein
MGLPEFLAGWALGAKTGNQGFDDVVETTKAVAQSKEFKDLLAVLRSHAGYSLRQMGNLVAGDSAEPAADLLDMVRSLVGRRDGPPAPWPGRIWPVPDENDE